MYDQEKYKLGMCKNFMLINRIIIVFIFLINTIFFVHSRLQYFGNLQSNMVTLAQKVIFMFLITFI